MSKQNPTVMVVEDEVLLLQAITKKLKLSNMDVLSCSSGQQAVDYLDSLDELPDAVWLDYYLKDMNGLAFMQTIRENPKWANIPVIVVSNSAAPEKVHTMLGLGAKKYILKAEHRLDEIIQMIRDFIHNSDKEPPEAATAVVGTVPTAATSAEAPPPAAEPSSAAVPPPPADSPPKTPTAPEANTSNTPRF